jgi:hypothetical protein
MSQACGSRSDEVETQGDRSVLRYELKRAREGDQVVRAVPADQFVDESERAVRCWFLTHRHYRDPESTTRAQSTYHVSESAIRNESGR